MVPAIGKQMRSARNCSLYQTRRAHPVSEMLASCISSMRKSRQILCHRSYRNKQPFIEMKEVARRISVTVNAQIKVGCMWAAGIQSLYITEKIITIVRWAGRKWASQRSKRRAKWRGWRNEHLLWNRRYPSERRAAKPVSRAPHMCRSACLYRAIQVSTVRRHPRLESLETLHWLAGE